MANQQLDNSTDKLTQQFSCFFHRVFEEMTDLEKFPVKYLCPDGLYALLPFPYNWHLDVRLENYPYLFILALTTVGLQAIIKCLCSLLIVTPVIGGIYGYNMFLMRYMGRFVR